MLCRPTLNSAHWYPGGADAAMAEAAAALGPRLSRAQAATLDVLVAELLTERRAVDAPYAVADVTARAARVNLAFPEPAVVQARAPPSKQPNGSALSEALRERFVREHMHPAWRA